MLMLLVYSQLGHVLCVAPNEVLEGQATKSPVMRWKSDTCQRICRGTFAAEVMAGVEGWEMD